MELYYVTYRLPLKTRIRPISPPKPTQLARFVPENLETPLGSGPRVPLIVPCGGGAGRGRVGDVKLLDSGVWWADTYFDWARDDKPTGGVHGAEQQVVLGQ